MGFPVFLLTADYGYIYNINSYLLVEAAGVEPKAKTHNELIQLNITTPKK